MRLVRWRAGGYVLLFVPRIHSIKCNIKGQHIQSGSVWTRMSSVFKKKILGWNELLLSLVYLHGIVERNTPHKMKWTNCIISGFINLLERNFTKFCCLRLPEVLHALTLPNINTRHWATLQRLRLKTLSQSRLIATEYTESGVYPTERIAVSLSLKRCL